MKELKAFQKLFEQISQSPQFNRSRQSQSNRGNVFKETDQELGISGNTGAYPINPSEQAIFGSNKIKEQYETMKLQNEEFMLKNA